MFQLFEQGLKLQKLAKGKRYNENKVRDEIAKGTENEVIRTGYIDFQVIGNEGNVDIKKYRKKDVHIIKHIFFILWIISYVC